MNSPAPSASTSPPSHPAIEFRGVRTELGGRVVLDGVDLAIRKSETLVLLGRSGSGKTTALRLINRLLEPSAGEVLVDGRRVADWEPTALRRGIGYVVQEVGLFPHFTIARNIGLVPSLEHWPETRIATRVRELMELMGLDVARFASRYPHELSGGQRQRVGVARALAADPPILLMDEPFGALDPLTRAKLQEEFMALQERLKKTIVFVTHDVREALLLAGRIAILVEGRVAGLQEPSHFLEATEPEAASYVEALRQQDDALAARIRGVR
jgi:osmoprotectant transport system ATP-binding protein